MKKQVVFVDSTPRCPCGSVKFDSTFEMLGAGKWRIESICCYECDAEIEITEELESFIRGVKWTLHTQER